MSPPLKTRGLYSNKEVEWYWVEEREPKTSCDSCGIDKYADGEPLEGIYKAVQVGGRETESYLCGDCYAEMRDGARAHCGMNKHQRLTV